MTPLLQFLLEKFLKIAMSVGGAFFFTWDLNEFCGQLGIAVLQILSRRYQICCHKHLSAVLYVS